MPTPSRLVEVRDRVVDGLVEGLVRGSYVLSSAVSISVGLAACWLASRIVTAVYHFFF